MKHKLKITIEGPCGSGKTVFATILQRTLELAGIPVENKDPGGTRVRTEVHSFGHPNVDREFYDLVEIHTHSTDAALPDEPTTEQADGA